MNFCCGNQGKPGDLIQIWKKSRNFVNVTLLTVISIGQLDTSLELDCMTLKISENFPYLFRLIMEISGNCICRIPCLPVIAFLHCRSTEKKKLMTEASKRNKQLFDDISVTERNLRTAKYSSSENRLDLLRDHYFEYVKSKYPEFLKNIEAEKEMSCSFSD